MHNPHCAAKGPWTLFWKLESFNQSQIGEWDLIVRRGLGVLMAPDGVSSGQGPDGSGRTLPGAAPHGEEIVGAVQG